MKQINGNEFNLNNYNQFQREISNNEEVRKQLTNLKNNLQKKEYELKTINNLYEEVKKVNDQLRQECDNLNEKNITLINEKSSIEKKFEDEIENIEMKYKTKLNEYEIQIKKYSSFNIDSIKNRIENDLKNEFEEKIFLKDKEILEKNQIIEQLTNDYNLLKDNFQLEKELLLKDMNTLKNLHKTETNDLLERIQLLKENKNNSIFNLDNDTFLHIKTDIENTKRLINILTNENYKIKREKESLVKEKNELKMNNLILVDKLKLEEKKNEFEIKRLNISLDNLRIENNSLKNENKQNENKIKDYYIERKNIKNDLFNKEFECQQLQNEINVLNNLLKTHQDELDNNLTENYKIQNEIILKGRKDEEKYKKEIKDLTIKLKENKNLENYEEIINDKEEKIIKLKKKIKELESESEVDAKLIKNYNDVIRKKKYYKDQCKQANEKLSKIIEKLNPEQIKEFKNLIGKNNKDILDISQSGVI